MESLFSTRPALFITRIAMRRNAATKKGEDIEYLRQSHNLSNNLLGKATPNTQPTLFEGWAAQLTEDERAKCLDEKIELIGFDLLAAEQCAIEAVLKLVARGGYKTTKLKFGLNKWLKAYGVEKFLNEKKGWLNQSGKEREQALRALEPSACAPASFRSSALFLPQTAC